jgi:hypothetical protein
MSYHPMSENDEESVSNLAGVLARTDARTAPACVERD